VADWATISALATAGGTLVLAGATFASVRSANRAARAAETSLLAGLRPLLLPSHLEDAAQKVSFVDGHVLIVRGGGGTVQVEDDAILLAMSVRNVGSGIAVLHGWHLRPELWRGDHADLDDFTALTRDIYVPSGDVGFWQGSFRDPGSPKFEALKRVIHARERFTVDVLYGDFEGGQRIVTRFGFLPHDEGWLLGAGRHWNVDRPSPR
jgi:hypothetical protein